MSYVGKETRYIYVRKRVRAKHCGGAEESTITSCWVSKNTVEEMESVYSLEKREEKVYLFHTERRID